MQQQETQQNGTALYFNAMPGEQRKVDIYNATVGRLPDYDCPTCLNRGYLGVISENGMMAVRKCKCIAARESIRQAKKSGAYVLMCKHKFDNFLAATPWQGEVKGRAQEYAANANGEWFFFGGQSGAGKTHICTAVFSAAFKKQNAGLYIMWRDEARQIIGAGFKESQSTELRVKEIKNTPLLYIDDFLKGDDSHGVERREWELAFEIINYRYANNFTTIISSEKTLGDISGSNQAIAGRIKERCGQFVLTIESNGNKNYRLVEAAQ